MQVKVIQSLAEFEAMEVQWNDHLGRSSASHVPFLRHEYLKSWWETKGGGEWAQGDLWIVIGVDNDDHLSGIAPLFYSVSDEGENALNLLNYKINI